MSWTLLVNCADDFEADMVISFLAEQDIAHLKRYRGTGYYVKAVFGQGRDIDILVLEKDFERAKEIIESLRDE